MALTTEYVLGPLDTTVRLKVPAASLPSINAQSIAVLLSSFGKVIESDIVISSKPNKKNPNKPAKFTTVLVPFNDIGDAFSAIGSTGKGKLDGIECSWAQGTEPELVAWMRKRGELSLKKAPRNASQNDQTPSFSFSTAPPTSDSVPLSGASDNTKVGTISSISLIQCI